jgi:hypothetical protein
MNTFGGAYFENGGAKHTQAPLPNCAYDLHSNEMPSWHWQGQLIH